MSTPAAFGTGGHQSAGQTFPGPDYYSNVGLGRCAMMFGGFTDESQVSQIIRVAGEFSQLSWGLDTAFGTSLTLALNRNSSTTVLAVSIGALTTGWVTDNSDSAQVSNGDELDFAVAVGMGTISGYNGSFYCTSARFDAGTGSARMLTAVGPNFIYPKTTTSFISILGTVGLLNPTESDEQLLCSAEGMWQNMACFVETNSFGGSTTITSRKNGANVRMAISIPAGKSGYFEDVSDKDRAYVGDLLDYGFTTSESGTG